MDGIAKTKSRYWWFDARRKQRRRSVRRSGEEPLAGAIVCANDAAVISDRNGAYIVRRLPTGRIKLFARSSETGAVSSEIFVDLSFEPTTKRAVNLAVRP